MKQLKHIFSLAVLFIGLTLVAQSCAQTTNSIPPELRQSNFACDSATIQTALGLHNAGWTYIMPQPKSKQAAWGNRDGRTTWYVGYWTNSKNQSTSSTQPKKDEQGQWVGDGNGIPGWRRGGSPAPPTKIEWFCSKSGGIPPN